MEVILEWAKDYSAPVVLLLAFGAALLFVFQRLAEKSVESMFERRNQRIELLLRRRSSFEEKVLTDRYSAVAELALRLGKIGADLNRLHHGKDVPGLLDGDEIVPLTEVYIDLEARRFLLGESFHALLREQARCLLHMANVRDEAAKVQVSQDYLAACAHLREEMNRNFGLDSIAWDDLKLVGADHPKKPRA